MSKENNTDTKKAWISFIIVLVVSLLLETIMTPHPYFEFDGFPGFYAIFGFISCVLIVLVSKFLGIFLKRKEDYYNDDSGGNK